VVVRTLFIENCSAVRTSTYHNYSRGCLRRTLQGQALHRSTLARPLSGFQLLRTLNAPPATLQLPVPFPTPARQILLPAQLPQLLRLPPLESRRDFRTCRSFAKAGLRCLPVPKGAVIGGDLLAADFSLQASTFPGPWAADRLTGGSLRHCFPASCSCHYY